MQYDWFLLDLESGVIKANDNLPDDIKNKVVYTINELKLNSNDDRVQIRFNIIKEYRDGSFSSDFLHNRYPFIAYEIKRQKMQSNKI